MHSIRITGFLLVITSLAAAPLLAQTPPSTTKTTTTGTTTTTSTAGKDGKKTTSTPTVVTGGTTATASEGSTAMAIRGRPRAGTARRINAETGLVTAQTDDRQWTVNLRVSDRALLGRVRPGDALTLDLVAGSGTVRGQSCPIVNLTSEIRFTARQEAEQLCAKTQADMNADAAAAAAAGNYSPRWRCSVKEFPGETEPWYMCMCVPAW